MLVAQSRQKRLWPQGTRAAITWLSIQWIHTSCPLPADPSPDRKDSEDSGGEEEEAVLSLEEEKAEL